MNNELDVVKYKIINIMNNLNNELIKIKEITEELNYVWLEIEKINDSYQNTSK